MKINKQQLQRIIKEEVRRAKRRLAEGHGGMGSYGGRDEENHGKRDGMAYGGRDEENMSAAALEKKHELEDAVRAGMTVGELRDLLRGYDEDEHVDIEDLLAKLS